MVATRINSLTKTLGCNGHIALYTNTSSIVTDIQYLGFRLWRDGIGGPLTGPQQAVFQSIVNAGISIIGLPAMATPPTNTTVASCIAAAKIIFNMGPNALYAMEGPDEPGNFAFEFGGVATTTSWSAVSAFQSAYYAAIKADSQLGTGAANIPVWTPSLVGQELDNAGLQFGCVVPAGGGGSSTPGLTVFADVLNCHVAPMFATNASQSIDPIAGDAFYHQLGSDFVSTYLHSFAGLTLPAAKALPHVISEFGYNTVTIAPGGFSVDVPTQGKCILNGILNAFSDGYQVICLNTLYEASTSGQGLFSGPGTPTLAGTYLHNFMAPLQDTGLLAASFTPGTLNYSLSGLPANGASAIFQKSNGFYELIIWNNVTNWNFATGVPIAISPTNVTVNFPVSQATVNVYDPISGSTSTSTNTVSVVIALKDYPIIVEVNPGGPPDVLVPSGGGTDIKSLPQSGPAGVSDTVALPLQGVVGGVPAAATALSAGSITNPSSSFARPANTIPYMGNDLIANSATAGSVVVPSFAILSTAGGAIIPRIRVLTNAPSGWNNVQLSINLWSAAPTYVNGDNGSYSVATGAASWLANYSVLLIQFVDGAVGGGVLTAANGAALKLASGTSIFYDIQIIGAATPIASQTFTIVPELLN